MQMNKRIAGKSHRYGIVKRRIQIPMRGKFKTTNIKFPIHMLAIRPQKSSGRSIITRGPGAIPWIMRAPNISAITAFAGIPRVNMGMKEV